MVSSSSSSSDMQKPGGEPVFLEPSFVMKRPLTEYFLIIMFGWIPTPIGTKLRNIFYPQVFQSMGRGLYIRNDVELVGTHNIRLGNAVSLVSRVQIDANASQSQVSLGDRVMLDRGADVRTVAGFEGCKIEILADTYIGPYVCLAGPGNISIGKNCMIASHSGIYANNHSFIDATCLIREQGLTRQGIVIGDDCWLGTGVKVLDGVTIGEGCVVGAGAVVTKDMPPYSIAVGVPAKVIGHRTSDVDSIRS